MSADIWSLVALIIVETLEYIELMKSVIFHKQLLFSSISLKL